MPISLINYSVTVTGKADRAQLASPSTANGNARADAARDAPRVPAGRARMGRGRRSTPSRPSPPAQGIEGPAIIDESDTTIYVPPGNRIERDEYMNYVLTR